MKYVFRRKEGSFHIPCCHCGSLETECLPLPDQDGPRFSCSTCYRTFGKPPVIQSRRGPEKLEEITQKLTFCFGSDEENMTEFTVRRQDDCCEAVVSGLADIALPVNESAVFSLVKWQRLMDILYHQAMVYDWQNNNSCKSQDPDYQWSLDIGLTHHRTLHYSGVGRFPHAWQALTEQIEPIYQFAETRVRGDLKMYVFVSFGGYGQEYSYLCEDWSIREGDRVRVPVGSDNQSKVVTVKRVQYLPDEQAPYPIDRIKRVLGREEPEK